MSVVACKVTKDKIVIGSDSIIMTGVTQEKIRNEKLIEVNNMIVGFAGDGAEGKMFHLYCSQHKPKKATELSVVDFMSSFQKWYCKKTDKSKTKNSYIIVFEDKAFMFEGFYIREIKDYGAVGAGMDYTLSALSLGHSVKKAIQVACDLSTQVEGPITIYKRKKN